VAAPGKGVVCVGNLVLDTLAFPVGEIRWDATVWVDSVAMSLGGNGANTSYTLARLGSRVRLLGTAGGDANGDFVVETLRQAGVDVSLVARSPEPTAATVALVRADGARAFLHRPGAGAGAFASPVDAASAGAGFGCFHVANPFALPLLRRTAGESLRRARAEGLRTSLDTGWDARGEWMEVLAPCLPHVDLLFANLDEARHLTGREDEAGAAAFFADRGVETVAIKLGANGCFVRTIEGAAHFPPIETTVADSTGAGDCFVGGFLAALDRGLPVHRAAEAANAVGAMSVRRLGAVAGVGTWEETIEFMSR
jgi:sugar/nucleoside kinase (ribokinase family)